PSSPSYFSLSLHDALPILIVIGLIFIGPFLWMIGVAFMSGEQDVYTFPPSFIPDPPVLDNIINAWTVVPYGKYMLNSFIILGIIDRKSTRLNSSHVSISYA